MLLISLVVHSQPGKKGIRSTAGLLSDSTAIKIQQMKDSVEKTLDDIQWQNNMRNVEDLMKTVEKREKKDKTKAIVYIVIGVGMLLVLVFGLLRRNAEKKANG